MAQTQGRTQREVLILPLSTYAIEAQGLVRRFGPVEALAQVTLAIRRGEFFSLLGPSGCGKTTLLRIIAGLDLPDGGTLMIGGADAASIPAHRRPVNTVFQSYALFPHMTAWDNVAFGLRMKKTPAVAIKERVTRVMSLLEVTEFASRKPAQLSGGQKQRVALARAVVNEPEVLLLDEPLGALDLKLRKQLQLELHQLQRRLGITFIYVTHDQEEALVMSDRIAVMNAGRIEQIDAAADLYERPRSRFVAQFLGLCNLLPGTVTAVSASRLHIDTPVGQLVALMTNSDRAFSPGQQINLALRPEKIRLSTTEPADAPNRLPAVIEEVVYGGSETRYRLRSGETTLNVVALNTQPGHQGLQPKAQVWCSFPPETLVPLAD